MQSLLLVGIGYMAKLTLISYITSLREVEAANHVFVLAKYYSDIVFKRKLGYLACTVKSGHCLQVLVCAQLD